MEGTIKMKMKLLEYLEELKTADMVVSYDLNGQEETLVHSIMYDSREAVSGGVFICKGANFSEEYLESALKKGCCAYISEVIYQTKEKSGWILVKDIRRVMPILAAKFYGTDKKSRDLHLTGITGTKGKTTTSYYLKAILDCFEKSRNHVETAILSTIEIYDGKERKPSVLTTPEALELHRHIRNAQDAGISYLTMEVSSQALKYQRIRKVQYDVGIFLNISEDHISPAEHGDFEDYFMSKLSLFKQVDTACINLDCDYEKRVCQAAHLAKRIVTFGRKEEADIQLMSVRHCENGLSFRVKCDKFDEEFHISMQGDFNAENAVAAIAAAYIYEVPVEIIKKALANVKVSGRMEEYKSDDKKITVIVDYAHNRLSFEKLFDSVFQEHLGENIVTVFGCPGQKAYNRRRELGMIAGLFSNTVYLTADDPGTEPLEKIFEDIRPNVETTGCACICVEDRKEAVFRAMREIKGKTVLLVLGKGNEGHQKIGKAIVPYPTDSELVCMALEEYNCMHPVKNIEIKK